MIDGLAGCLFGGHVFGSTDDISMCGVHRATKQLGNAEVGELNGIYNGAFFGSGESIWPEQIGWLEIAMHNTVIVCHFERTRDDQRCVHCLLPSKAAS